MKRVIAFALLGVLVAVPTLGQTRSVTEQKVLKASELLREASLITKDRAIMERLYADDYFYTHSHGHVENKKEEIDGSLSPNQHWTAQESSGMKVRVYHDVAVVTGVYTLTGSAGSYVGGPRRFTEVWVRRDGRWQMVVGQSTLVPAK